MVSAPITLRSAMSGNAMPDWMPCSIKKSRHGGYCILPCTYFTTAERPVHRLPFGRRLHQLARLVLRITDPDKGMPTQLLHNAANFGKQRRLLGGANQR